MDFIIIYTLAPRKGAAKKIVRRLLSQKLIACANIFPVDSEYLWEGAVAKAREYAMILKTRGDKFEAVKIEIKAMHPYNVPLIAKISAEANSGYLVWFNKELS